MDINKEIKTIKNSCSVVRSKTGQLRLPVQPTYEEKPYDIYESEENLTPEVLEIQIKILQRMCDEVLKYVNGLDQGFKKLIRIRERLL